MSDFNKDFLSGMGMDAKVVENAETQTIREGMKVIDSAPYKAEIRELAVFQSDKGATMMKVVTYIEKEDLEITNYQNTVKKDGTPNEIGQSTFRHILDATVGEDKSVLSNKKEEIIGYGKKVEGTVVKGLAGKKFIALVREVHEEGSKYPKTNEIEAFAKVDGTNSKGEDLLEAFKKKIAETPILNRTSKDGAATGGATTGTTTATKESIADQL